MNLGNQPLFRYLSLVQPIGFVWMLLTYSIGLGLVHYQGGNLNWVNMVFGVLLISILFLTRIYLIAYFNHPLSSISDLNPKNPAYDRLKPLDRQMLLIFALALLTASALIFVLLIIRHAVTIQMAVITITIYLLTLFTAVPPVQLDKRGYGEVADAIMICNLTPAIAFLLHRAEIHVLLIMLTLPLTFLFFSHKIILSLETFAFDQSHYVPSFARKVSWQKAMGLHNTLVLAAFLLVAVFALLGQPWSLTWPMLMPLLIGVVQVFQILRIISGAPTHWKVLKILSGSTFAITAYLVTLSLWIS